MKNIICKMTKSWLPWAGLFMVLVGIALLDNVISRQQLPALKEENLSGPLSEYVMEMTRLSRARDRLLPVIEDSQAPAKDRLAAFNEYEPLLLEDGDVHGALELNRYIVQELNDSVDLKQVAEKLIGHYSGKKPITGAGKQAQKDAQSTKNVPSLIWIISRRIENIRANLTGRHYWGGMAALGVRAAENGLQAQALEALESLQKATGDSRTAIRLLGVVDSIQQKTPRDQWAELMGKLVEFLRHAVTEKPDAAVCEKLVEMVAGWYENEGVQQNPRLKKDVLGLLVYTETTCADPSLKMQCRLFCMYAGEASCADHASRLEHVLRPRLEASVRTPSATVEEFNALRVIYRRGQDELSLKALAALETKHGVTQKRLAALSKELKPVLADLRAARLDQAAARVSAVIANYGEAPEAASLILSLKQILAMARLGGKQFHDVDTTLFDKLVDWNSSAVPPELRGLHGQWCIRAFCALRNAGKRDLAKQIARLGLESLEPSAGFKTWLESELWILKGQQGPAPRHVVDVPYLPQTDVVIDGKLDDAAYAKATPIADFCLVAGGKVVHDTLANRVRTVVKIVHDGKWLYVAIKAAEPAMRQSKVTLTERDSDVWREDCIEFFVDAGRSMETFQQWVVNRLGAVVDLKHTDVGFNLSKATLTGVRCKGDKTFTTGVETAGQQGPAGWTIEFRIPLRDLIGLQQPCHGALVAANIRRYRYEAGKLAARNWDCQPYQGFGLEIFNYLRLE